MAKRRLHQMTHKRWLKLAQSNKVLSRIASDNGMDDFQAIIRAVARCKKLDWDEAVAILHMVYGWMPTMLRKIEMSSPDERESLIATLRKAKSGRALTTYELEEVQRFSNRSIIGASKLLHVICPESYPIWDSRVAQEFLWRGVSQGTFSQLQRYVDYVSELHEWLKEPEVIAECSAIRCLNPALSEAGNLRLIELVLFRSKK